MGETQRFKMGRLMAINCATVLIVFCYLLVQVEGEELASTELSAALTENAKLRDEIERLQLACSASNAATSSQAAAATENAETGGVNGARQRINLELGEEEAPNKQGEFLHNAKASLEVHLTKAPTQAVTQAVTQAPTQAASTAAEAKKLADKKLAVESGVQKPRVVDFQCRKAHSWMLLPGIVISRAPFTLSGTVIEPDAPKPGGTVFPFGCNKAPAFELKCPKSKCLSDIAGHRRRKWEHRRRQVSGEEINCVKGYYMGGLNAVNGDTMTVYNFTTTKVERNGTQISVK